MNKYLGLAAGCIIAVSVSACSKKAPETLPPPAVQTAPSAATQQPAAPARIVPGSQADFVNQMSGRDTIFFDTDRYNIDSEDAAALRAQAEWLARYPEKRARVEGHADERGTREYNLALGERRANAAKNYLVSLGISETRITVLSYGEERPAATASNEAAWAQNRRAVTITID